jgi:hypothetical protein
MQIKHTFFVHFFIFFWPLRKLQERKKKSLALSRTLHFFLLWSPHRLIAPSRSRHMPTLFSSLVSFSRTNFYLFQFLRAMNSVHVPEILMWRHQSRIFIFYLTFNSFVLAQFYFLSSKIEVKNLIWLVDWWIMKFFASDYCIVAFFWT